MKATYILLNSIYFSDINTVLFKLFNFHKYITFTNLISVAINYGIFRRKDFNETAQNVMFYDMGAGSTAAAVVSYSVSKGRDADPQATILGVG